MPDQTSVDIRVRYPECDAQSVAHHSVFPVWMEIARVELLRVNGIAYRDCEEKGVYFVVVNLQIRFRKPAKYDDVITVEVKHTNIGRIRIDHEYRITRGEELLAEASTTLACVNGEGKPTPMPEGFISRA